MNCNDIFTIEYEHNILNIELKNKFYKESLNGCIQFYIDKKYQGIYLYYKLRRELNQRRIEITDIPFTLSDKYKNNGIGTRALKILDWIATHLKVSSIFGGLSKLNFDHIDRLLYFYKKNNYEILMDTHNKPCGINKKVVR